MDKKGKSAHTNFKIICWGGTKMDQTNKARWRVVWLFCGMLAVCTVLMLRLYRLSMDSSLLQAAQSQGSYTLEVTTTRGRIYDRSLLPLTDTEQSRVLAVLPTPEAGQACAEQIEGPQRRTALDSIAQGSPFLIDVGSGGTVYSSDVENFIVSSRLPHDTSEQLAIHLIGYLDGEGKGVTGLEQAYEEPLSAAGQQVSVRCQVDALGQPMNSEGMQVTGDSTPPQEGVVLTLDRRMQRVVQRVGQQIEQGAIVVMDVQTGELAACASFPQYDPYNLEEALTDPDKPLLNRALMSYNVGSSFKLAVAAAALEEGISPAFSVNCVGGITVAGRIFYCHNRAGHQETDLRRAIEQSCNPYFVKLGQAAGGEQILGMAKALGFGRSTELAPGLTAAAGTLPTESDLQNLHELANFSFGQGKLTATPVQIAAMVSAVANGGMAVTPKLVLGTTADGQTVDYQQQPAAVRVFSEQTAAILREDMIGVVEEGSAPLAKPKEGGAGGKTASAQTGQYDEEGEEIVHAWFSGFFPAQQPKYAVVILIEGGEFGGQVASPLFQQIADTYGPVGE